MKSFSILRKPQKIEIKMIRSFAAVASAKISIKRPPLKHYACRAQCYDNEKQTQKTASYLISN